jgi:hypothetical protein
VIDYLALPLDEMGGKSVATSERPGCSLGRRISSDCVEFLSRRVLCLVLPYFF